MSQIEIQHSRPQTAAIPNKYRELMALAVAFTNRCPFCVELHVHRAREANASDQEIAEVSAVADVVRAGVAITHGEHGIA